MASTFNLEGFPNPVEVTLPEKFTSQELLGFEAFNNWTSSLKHNLALQQDPKHAFHKYPYRLTKIEVQSFDKFGPTKIGFVKLKATVISDNEDAPELPGIAFLRGGSVAVLMILRPTDSMDEKWVVMTEQPRIPACSLSFREIPAGMLEKGKSLRGNAAAEIEEETGFVLPEDQLIDLTKLALQQAETQETLQPAIYPSPGGSDEYIPIFLWEKELDRQEIEDLRGRLTGLRTQGEMITLRVVRYEELWRTGARDAKTLAAWALYEGLNRAGVIQKEIKRRQGMFNTSNDIIP
ncbi:hypothetical protein PFICI_09735 [Pestalotiopsis fici W106-1]|uniref:Nudix hydrolase domain-containing protein n=1 Tax=Pestalotiopsis fici (strain W106-1 / CGMCC3.15140) TaxID=1229662 RepID=W3WUX7_PESFW|nr:uncharacterized protein PFICI_09735 [Pestalotiopsis fici W106-1]ETS77673.1 hypothetical protein PFICI_09735 [Pestalotiopsis fici W106-1]